MANRVTTLAKNLSHAWNLFRASEFDQARPRPYSDSWGGTFYGARPDRPTPLFSNERTIVSSIFNRLAIDLAGVDIRHVKVDDQDRYTDDVKSGLQYCLQWEANIDQAASFFRQDVFSTLIQRGSVALVPVDTSINPDLTGGYDILTMRVGEILAYHSKDVRLSVFNEKTLLREEVTVPKSTVAIVENPLYAVMNEPNSTLKRLVAKLAMLDEVDKQSSSGKLDLILQFPYQVRGARLAERAEERRKAIETQLKDSQYGIAWADGTEKITQLNRPVENNLLAQIDRLTEELYGELGLTKNLMLGTAEEGEYINYWARTLEPIIRAVVEEMRRKFLTKTARTQRQTILYFRDPFKLVPLGGEHGLAQAIDVLSRNQIVTPNESRQVLGFKPAKDDPEADLLRNSNMPQPAVEPPADADVVDGTATDIAGTLEEFVGSGGE